MASPVRTYQKRMHDEVGFFATWLPGDRIELGEAGVFKDGRFRRESSLAEYGISFESSPPGTPQTLQYSSASGTAVKVSGGADAALLARAEIEIEFSKKGAFLFHASGVRQLRIENRRKVGEALVGAYQRGEWNKDWWVVEALHVAACATVMISRDRASSLRIAASSTEPLGSLPLANPDATLSVTSSSGEVFHLVAGKKLRPLFACIRVRDPFFGGPEVKAVRGRKEDVHIEFERPAIAALLDT